MTTLANLEPNRDRIKSAAGVVAFHALLGYALITGLGFEVAGEAGKRLKVFDVVEQPLPPPPEVAVAAEARAEKPEGAASPPNLEAKASPVVAPPPEIRLEVPPPIVAAPAPGQGGDASAGAAEVIGPGTGSGGEGNGTGSGRAGDGAGGGGIAARARWVRGRLEDSDYPRGAGRVGAGGTVIVRFSVRADGRVSGCTVTRSSGNAELDATTCRLIERRFRYEPAKDAAGRPVVDVMGWKQVWWIEQRGRASASPDGDGG